MSKKRIIIDGNYQNEFRGVLLNKNNQIEEFEYETKSHSQIKGNIYLAVVTRVEPSLQAAFIDYGNNKNGFLPFSEIQADYYNTLKTNEKSSQLDLKPMAIPQITETDLQEQKDLATKPQQEDETDFFDLDKIATKKEVLETIEIEDEESDNDIEPVETEILQTSPKQYKIQEVIKKGQILLVQAQKEERGNKGASFTTYISLAGKYCVLVPNKARQHGISRRIINIEERKRLKEIIKKLIPEADYANISIITRTAAINKTTYELKRDYEYLAKLWNKIRDITLYSKAPAFIHMEEGIIQKTIRDIFDHNVEEIIIQGNEAYQQAKDFMSNMLPSEVEKIKKYNEDTPIFTKFNIESQLSTLYQPIVSLPSGGYAVINPTEALTSIDVNSGKSINEHNLEKTALKTNLEAALVISRQIKLRDIAGLIVIDFIDMRDSTNRTLIRQALNQYFKKDRAKARIGSISQFGLLEMSRQRLRSSFLETNSAICKHCSGKGIIRNVQANSMVILRIAEQEIISSKSKVTGLNVFSHLEAILPLLNDRRNDITQLENKYNIKINFYNDSQATSDTFALEVITIDHEIEQNNNYSPPKLTNFTKVKDNVVENHKKIIEEKNSGDLEQINQDNSSTQKPLLSKQQQNRRNYRRFSTKPKKVAQSQ